MVLLYGGSLLLAPGPEPQGQIGEDPEAYYENGQTHIVQRQIGGREVEGFQDHLAGTWARRVRGRATDLPRLHVRPLVDQQSLVGVPEPGEIRQPLEVDRHGARVQEEAAEQQEGYDHRRAHRQGHRGRGAGAGYQVAEGRGHVRHQGHYGQAVEEVQHAGPETDHRIGNGREHQRHCEKKRQLGNGLAQEVRVAAVEATPGLSHEHGQFGGEHLWKG